MKALNGIIDKAEFYSSPNCDSRPDNIDIDLFVIHAISLPPGDYNTQLINFLITRSGNLIQFVPIHKRSWHAGKSSFQGRTNCNDFSIGIELEGCDNEEFTFKQYDALSELILFLSDSLKINKNNIVGHSEIAPERKTDPGPYFDWNLLKSML